MNPVFVKLVKLFFVLTVSNKSLRTEFLKICKWGLNTMLKCKDHIKQHDESNITTKSKLFIIIKHVWFMVHPSSLLPSQQSCHMRRSIWGMSSQLLYPWGSSATLKTSCWTRVMLSPLSHSTRVREACFNCVSWAGVNTPGFSYQNLNVMEEREVTGWKMY